MSFLILFVIALAIGLIFFRRHRAAKMRWRRVVLFVGNRLKASFPVLRSSSPISVLIRQKGADGKPRYERLRVAYAPHNLLGVAWEELTFYIGLRGVEYVLPVRGELHLRVFDQVLHVHATQDQLTVSLQIVQSPTRPMQTMPAVHPRLKIIARRAA